MQRDSHLKDPPHRSTFPNFPLRPPPHQQTLIPPLGNRTDQSVFGLKRRHSYSGAAVPEQGPQQGRTLLPMGVPIGACNKCRERKAQCDSTAADAACDQCRHRGLECVPNENVQNETKRMTTVGPVVSGLVQGVQPPNMTRNQASGRSTDGLTPSRDRRDGNGSTASVEFLGSTTTGDRKVDSAEASVPTPPRKRRDWTGFTASVGDSGSTADAGHKVDSAKTSVPSVEVSGGAADGGQTAGSAEASVPTPPRQSRDRTGSTASVEFLGSVVDGGLKMEAIEASVPSVRDSRSATDNGHKVDSAKASVPSVEDSKSAAVGARKVESTETSVPTPPRNRTHRRRRDRRRIVFVAIPGSATNDGRMMVSAGTSVPSVTAAATATAARAAPLAFSPPSQYALGREENRTSSSVTAPLGSQYQVTQRSQIQAGRAGRQHTLGGVPVNDFISRRVVGAGEAQELLNYFFRTLSPYLWDGVLPVHRDLTSVRNSSTMLTAAILTVAALHMPRKERTYNTCFVVFLNLVSSSMWTRRYSLDDLRALCIGAVWLADVNWRLMGHAVSVATELGLHRSYQKVSRGLWECEKRARLWCFICILEQYSSTAYGRLPIVHDDQRITDHRAFASPAMAPQSDTRLHCQVDLSIILTWVHYDFGSDVDLEVFETALPIISRYDAALREWHDVWSLRLMRGPSVVAYPYQIVKIYYHCSRFQLHTVALRTYMSSTSTRPMSELRRQHANLAISSARAMLEAVRDDRQIQTTLVGMPLYLHGMITFAAVFLLKIVAKCHPSARRGMLNSIAGVGLTIEGHTVRALVRQIVELMVRSAWYANTGHPTRFIAHGLRKMLGELEQGANRGVQPSLPTSYSSAFPVTQPDLPEELADCVMADRWGLNVEYFPSWVLAFVRSQMPG